MRERVLDFLRCPDCGEKFDLTVFDLSDDEIESGILHCGNFHFFPIAGGIPRMLPSSLKDYWPKINAKIPTPQPEAVKTLLEKEDLAAQTRSFDTRTKANFSNEWDHHDIGGRTWTMDLSDRIRWFFLEPIRIRKKS